MIKLNFINSCRMKMEVNYYAEDKIKRSYYLKYEINVK